MRDFILFYLWQRNFMEQFLDQSEGTQKTADKASQQYAQQNQNSCDIIGKAEFRRAYHRLKGPDGTGAGGCRTGIAVEPRHADGLPRALVQPALKKIRQMQIGQ